MIRKMIFAACAAGAALSMAGAASAAPNLIINGDFEALNTGFNSSYTYVAPPYGPGHNLIPEGTYTVGNNPNAAHPSWKDQGGSPNELLIVNGDVQNGLQFVYTSNLVGSAAAGKYDFSFDLGSVCCNASFGSNPNQAPAIDYFYVYNGTPVFLGTATAPTSTNNSAVSLSPISGSFVLPGSGSLQFRLAASTSGASGNDFAIDNISVSAAPEPSSWALMIAGVGLMGFALRTSRRRISTNRFA